MLISAACPSGRLSSGGPGEGRGLRPQRGVFKLLLGPPIVITVARHTTFECCCRATATDGVLVTVCYDSDDNLASLRLALLHHDLNLSPGPGLSARACLLMLRSQADRWGPVLELTVSDRRVLQVHRRLGLGPVIQ